MRFLYVHLLMDVHHEVSGGLLPHIALVRTHMNFLSILNFEEREWINRQ